MPFIGLCTFRSLLSYMYSHFPIQLLEQLRAASGDKALNKDSVPKPVSIQVSQFASSSCCLGRSYG